MPFDVLGRTRATMGESKSAIRRGLLFRVFPSFTGGEDLGGEAFSLRRTACPTPNGEGNLHQSHL